MLAGPTFTKFSLSHDQYFTLHEDLLDRKTILALHGDIGYMTSAAPFYERFYGGGIGSIRGFAFRGVQPAAGPDDDVIGGDFAITGSAEVSFPLYSEELQGRGLHRRRHGGTGFRAWDDSLQTHRHGNSPDAADPSDRPRIARSISQSR